MCHDCSGQDHLCSGFWSRYCSSSSWGSRPSLLPREGPGQPALLSLMGSCTLLLPALLASSVAMVLVWVDGRRGMLLLPRWG